MRQAAQAPHTEGLHCYYKCQHTAGQICFRAFKQVSMRNWICSEVNPDISAQTGPTAAICWTTPGPTARCCCSISAFDWWICDVNSRRANPLVASQSCFTAVKFMGLVEYFLFLMCLLCVLPVKSPEGLHPRRPDCVSKWSVWAHVQLSLKRFFFWIY